MRMEEVNARKEYIKNVRKSFDSPTRKYEFEKEADTKRESEGGFPFFKIRLIIAAILFAVYIYCDKTDISIYNVTAEDVTEKIAANFDYEKAGDEILETFHSIWPE